MNIQVLSDQHLLNNYRSGDQSAISKLIERHKRRVRDYIYMMVKDNDVADRELISLRLSSNVTTRRLERSSSGSRCSVCSNGVLLPLSRCSGESVIKKATITVALGSG